VRPRAKVTIDSLGLQEVVNEKSTGIKMNDLDLDHNTIRAQYLESSWIQGLRSKGPPTGNGLWAIKWPRDQ